MRSWFSKLVKRMTALWNWDKKQLTRINTKFWKAVKRSRHNLQFANLDFKRDRGYLIGATKIRGYPIAFGEFFMDAVRTKFRPSKFDSNELEFNFLSLIIALSNLRISLKLASDELRIIIKIVKVKKTVASNDWNYFHTSNQSTHYLNSVKIVVVSQGDVLA